MKTPHPKITKMRIRGKEEKKKKPKTKKKDPPKSINDTHGLFSS